VPHWIPRKHLIHYGCFFGIVFRKTKRITIGMEADKNPFPNMNSGALEILGQRVRVIAEAVTNVLFVTEPLATHGDHLPTRIKAQ